MIRGTKRFLLAGASALAIITAVSGEAQAFTYTLPGIYTLDITIGGEYAITVVGASGGDSPHKTGGLGALLSGDLFIPSGVTLGLLVGGQGMSGDHGNGTGGGGGGASFVTAAPLVLAIAGGGGGAGFQASDGGPGLTTQDGGNGGGTGGGAGGTGGNGGSGGTYAVANGAGGLGFLSPGTDGSGANSGHAGIGFAGGAGFAGTDGGYGGGGGAGFNGGGGGGGVSGGGGGSGGPHASPSGYGGGGGGSYLYKAFTNTQLIAGINSGDGSISIALVPEPSTWAMTLAGFAGLGWLARLSRRKVPQGG
jgi:hypothetical protein